MWISSAAFSIGRRYGGGGSVRCLSFVPEFAPWPRLKPEGSRQPKISRVPHLMLCSAADPKIRQLYDLGDDNQRSTLIKHNREIYLPEIEGEHCIGSSYGIVFTQGFDGSDDFIIGVNPLSGDGFSLPYLPRYPTEDATYRRPFDDIHSKVTLSPSLDIAILLRRTDWLNGYAYLAHLTPRDCAWTPIPSPLPVLADCAFHKGHLILVDSKGHFTTCKDAGGRSGPRSLLHSSNIDSVKEYKGRKYLVESPDGDDLFLVHREHDYHAQLGRRTRRFFVWRLDKNGRYMWEHVDSLGGGLAFFVGSVRSFSLPAADFPCLKPDSIYFTKDLNLYSDYLPDKCGGLGDTGVFNLQDKSIDFFRLPEERDGVDWLPPVWVAP